MSKIAESIQVIRTSARAIWALSDPGQKCELTKQLWSQHQSRLHLSDLETTDAQAMNTDAVEIENLEAGRPDKPTLVAQSALAQRRLGSTEGRAAMLHAIAHIEFNAINLALDAIWRYPWMPDTFVADWLSVAADEARHFSLLTEELAMTEVRYGDFDAHDGLWDMARKTAPDLLSRMALVPRVLEARGLDATPQIQRKLKGQGDQVAIDILQIILDEEIRHVRVGDFWFRRLCRVKQVEPEATYRDLFTRFDAPVPAGKLNTDARLAAGFSEAELQWLSSR
jgi:uncharacterized ferritin-like protein (DUF455 family)